MKLTYFLLILAMISLIAALVLPALAGQRKTSRRQMQRMGARPLNLWERLALPFVAAMDQLAFRCQRWFPGNNRIALANALVTPAGAEDTKIADAAIGRRTVIKVGTDADHIDVCGTGDIPLGVTRDGSCAIAERVSFAQLGIYAKELEAVASGGITVGDMLVPGANGTVRKLPVANGTYYIIGRAKLTVVDGAAVPFVPCFPIQRVV